MAALSALSELLGKRTVPPHLHAFFVELARSMTEVLASLNERLAAAARGERVGGGDDDDAEEMALEAEEYAAKFTDLLSALLHLHLPRLEATPEFPLPALLTQLYRFTFALPAPDHLGQCVDIWCVASHLSLRAARVPVLTCSCGAGRRLWTA